MLLEGVASIYGVIQLAGLLLVVAALVDAAIRPAAAFQAADKQQKQFWLLVIGIPALALLIGFSSTLGLIGLIGVVAALVYLLDVRPVVKDYGRGGGRTGPYGPW